MLTGVWLCTPPRVTSIFDCPSLTTLDVGGAILSINFSRDDRWLFVNVRPFVPMPREDEDTAKMAEGQEEDVPTEALDIDQVDARGHRRIDLDPRVELQVCGPPSSRFLTSALFHSSLPHFTNAFTMYQSAPPLSRILTSIVTLSHCAQNPLPTHTHSLWPLARRHQVWDLASKSQIFKLKGHKGFTSKECPFLLFTNQSHHGPYISTGSGASTSPATPNPRLRVFPAPIPIARLWLLAIVVVTKFR